MDTNTKFGLMFMAKSVIEERTKLREKKDKKTHKLNYDIESAEERQERFDRQLAGAKCPY